MKIAVGGTFNVLHRGHRTLIETAFSRGDSVVVGITSDSFAQGVKSYGVPLRERRGRLEEYLASNFEGWEIAVLEEPMGPTASDRDIRVLVVSPGTYETGRRINEARKAKGLPAMELVMVPYVLADDFLPISSSRILAGEIDEEGRLKRPLRVMIGSTNPIKIGAASKVMERLNLDCQIISVQVEPTVAEQPFEGSTLEGARERALKALSDGDLGVGIEAGVFERHDGLYDVQFCAIADRRGWITEGHGSGFRYPPEIADAVRSGKTVSEAFDEIYGIKDIGRKEGAIGFLTRGALTREQLTEQAIMAAMVPRIRADLYTEI